MNSKIVLLVLAFGITFSLPCKAIIQDDLKTVLSGIIYLNFVVVLTYDYFKFINKNLSPKIMTVSLASFVGSTLNHEACRLKKEAIKTGIKTFFLRTNNLSNKADNYLYASGIISAIGTGSLIYWK